MPTHRRHHRRGPGDDARRNADQQRALPGGALDSRGEFRFTAHAVKENPWAGIPRWMYVCVKLLGTKLGTRIEKERINETNR